MESLARLTQIPYPPVYLITNGLNFMPRTRRLTFPFAFPRTLSFTAPVLFATVILAGCAQYENRRGVEVSWDETVTSSLIRGQSTRKDVLAALGPPSQVIALENETAMYYLFEHSRGDGVILIVYNRVDILTRYDRAIFFFDEKEVLTDYSTRVSDDTNG
jgi:outer membrane protein assembly factor BamE (lipoprotein component of BamABCDE complex)